MKMATASRKIEKNFFLRILLDVDFQGGLQLRFQNIIKLCEAARLRKHGFAMINWVFNYWDFAKKS
jgi:hypothetical protein